MMLNRNIVWVRVTFIELTTTYGLFNMERLLCRTTLCRRWPLVVKHSLVHTMILYFFCGAVTRNLNIVSVYRDAYPVRFKGNYQQSVGNMRHVWASDRIFRPYMWGNHDRSKEHMALYKLQDRLGKQKCGRNRWYFLYNIHKLYSCKYVFASLWVDTLKTVVTCVDNESFGHADGIRSKISRSRK